MLASGALPAMVYVGIVGYSQIASNLMCAMSQRPEAIAASEQPTPRHPKAEYLVYSLIFAPLLARVLFPLKREPQLITPLSALADPQILATGITALILIIVAARQPRTFRGVLGLPAVFVLMLATLGLASSLVSQFPMMTLWRTLELGVLALWAGVAVTQATHVKSVNALLNTLWTMTGALLVTALVATYVTPEDSLFIEQHVARIALSQGLTLSPNSIGVMAAVLAGAGYLRLLQKASLYWIVIVVGAVATVILSYSRTGLVVLLLALGLVSVLSALGLGRAALAWTLAGFLAVVSAGLLAISEEAWNGVWFLATRGGGMGTIEGLHGRVGLWERALAVFFEKPIFGWGYGVLPRQLGGSGHTHNAFLELAVGVGVFGLVVMFSFVLWLALRVSWLMRRLQLLDPNERRVVGDAAVVLLGFVVSNQATAAGAYYSWSLISVVVGGVASAGLAGRLRRSSRRHGIGGESGRVKGEWERSVSVGQHGGKGQLRSSSRHA